MRRRRGGGHGCGRWWTEVGAATDVWVRKNVMRRAWVDVVVLGGEGGCFGLLRWL